MLLATLLSTPLTLVPTLVMAAMAATAISEAIRVYSMAVAPRSFFVRRRKMDSITISEIIVGQAGNSARSLYRLLSCIINYAIVSDVRNAIRLALTETVPGFPL